MTTLSEEVAEVVRGLTKAQREAVLNSRDEWLNSREIGAFGAVLTALVFPPLNADLTMPGPLLRRDYQDRPLRYIYRLTPLGLAVRTALTASAGGE